MKTFEQFKEELQPTQVEMDALIAEYDALNKKRDILLDKVVKTVESIDLGSEENEDVIEEMNDELCDILGGIAYQYGLTWSGEYDDWSHGDDLYFWVSSNC